MAMSSETCTVLIGELAVATETSTRSLRHYEKLGIIKSRRAMNGYRQYGEETVEWVKAIRYLLCSGLSLRTIAEILPVLMNQECELTDHRVRAAIEYEADKIRAQIEKLQRSYSVLTAALEKGAIRRQSP